MQPNQTDSEGRFASAIDDVAREQSSQECVGESHPEFGKNDESQTDLTLCNGGNGYPHESVRTNLFISEHWRKPCALALMETDPKNLCH